MNASERRVRQRVAGPSLGKLWVIDVFIALLILMLLNTLALYSFRDAMFKAKLTQSMSAIAPQQRVLIEHYAHTGEWLDSDVDLLGHVGLRGGAEDAESANRPAGADAMSQMLSGKMSGRAATPAAGADGSQRGGVGATTVGISDGVIVTLGVYNGFEGVSMLGMRPAVVNAAEQPVVQWLCGRAPTPAGWQSPATAAPTNLPDRLLYSFCRSGVAS